MKTVTPVSSWSENFPPAPTWTSKDIPDLGGKVFVVTGGYGGIGYETTVRSCDGEDKGHSSMGRHVESTFGTRRKGLHQKLITGRCLDIRTDLTRAIHSEGWRIASWVVAAFEWCICYDAELGAVTRTCLAPNSLFSPFSLQVLAD